MLERIVRGVRAAAAGTILAATTLLTPPAHAQGHLTRFGFAGACAPEHEVATRPFTNLCVTGIDDPRLHDPTWVASLVRTNTTVAFTLGDVFVEETAPGTYAMRPSGGADGYLARWRAAIVGKERAIGALCEYVQLLDEPDVHGIPLAAVNAIHDTVKQDFPHAMTATVLSSGPNMRGWLGQGSLKADVVGYDKYGVYDPRTDPTYQSDLAFIESRTPGKKRVIIADTNYDPAVHGANGIAPDQMGHVMRNYYALAAADADVIALVGFLWRDLAAPHLGAPQLPIDAQAAYRIIGAGITGNCPFPQELAAFDPTIKPQHAMHFHGCKYLATMRYRIPWAGDQTGMAVAVPYSDIISNYWFFSPDNLEGTIKIFDFRPIGGKDVVYLTNNSDLPVDVYIFDTQRGTIAWEYHHDGGALAVVQGFGE